ncbi:MAG: mandelate racemase/muconate lactonizing enzyme family protein [Haliangiales bacterium]
MKIVDVQTFLADAGWRPWAFVKVVTDEGIVGYGECTCVFTQYSVLGAIEDMRPVLLGTDPCAYEMRFWDMHRRARLGSVGGAVSKAIGGIECALIDIKAKSLGISVAELFGGPLRESVPLYFSHFISSRMVAWEFLGVKPIRTMSDIADAAHEVVEQGYSTLKTNIPIPGDPGRMFYDGFGGGPGTTDQYASPKLLRHIETVFTTIHDAVPDVGLILDLNFNFKPSSAIEIAKVLRPFNLEWLELDILEPDALRQVKDAIDVPVCSCENMFYMEGYRPYFEKRAVDLVMIDVIWNGFAQSKKIGDLAQAHHLNVCPHNYYSHLSTQICANLAAVLPNVRIMEVDGDDVPWKNDFVTEPPQISNGELMIPTGVGWGTDLNEAEIKRRSWGNRIAHVSVPTGFYDVDRAADSAANDEHRQMLARTTYDSITSPWAEQREVLHPDEVYDDSDPKSDG